MKDKIFSELTNVFPCLIPLNGKIPIDEGWQYFCENTCLYNAKDFNGHNAGIPCGPANGCIVLDIDNHEKFDAWLKKTGNELPIDKRLHGTGDDGKHYFYQYPKNGKRYGNRSFKKDGFDIRGI